MIHESRLDAEARRLLKTRRTAALATADAQGHAHASAVPFAYGSFNDAACIVILTSALAAHTRHMQADHRVSLLIAEQEVEGQAVHALGRLSVAGMARMMERGSPEADALADSYLRRFPEAAQIAELPDFRYVAIEPTAVRQIAGFGAARDVPTDVFQRLLGTLG